jgi:choline dehydrogenase-like flavoprotein
MISCRFISWRGIATTVFPPARRTGWLAQQRRHHRCEPWQGEHMLGGRTNHWGRVSLRYGPYDFKPRSRDGLGVDWPLTYDELASSYDKTELLIAPYPEQLQDRATIFTGLHWIDAESNRRNNVPFLYNSPQMQRGILGDIAKKVLETEFAHQATFFQRLRFLVVSAYYTTPEGFRDIGYYGNVALSTYPPLTNEESAVLEGALSKLGP